MKTTKSIYFSILVCGMFAACQGTDKSGERYKDSSSLGERADSAAAVGSSSPTVNETSESKIDGDGAEFMKAAALGSSMEIELGKYAMKNSQNEKVKEFAAKMVADHTLAKSDLMKIAQNNGVLLPDDYPADVKAHMTEMTKMKGSAFDNHYVGMMVNDHAKTITLFKTAESLKDDVLKDYATKTLPVLQTHQKLANELAASMK
jgi:putative membrane protein